MKKLLLDEERFYVGIFLLAAAAILVILEHQVASLICVVIGVLFQISAFLQVQGKLCMLEILMRSEEDNLKWSRDRVPPIRERIFIKK